MLLQRIVRELKKNNLSDFLRKALFYSIRKGRLLWALNERDWQKKKLLAEKAFVYYLKENRYPKSLNISEVIVFAKTGEGRDPMMHAPAPVSPEQWVELGLKPLK